MRIKHYLLIALIVFLGSCEKENSNSCEDHSNYYRIEQSVHCIPNGYLFDEGQWSDFDSINLFNLMFANDDISFDLTDSIFSGKGDALTFSFLSQTRDNIEGTYYPYKYKIPAYIGAGHYENYDFTKHYRTNDSNDRSGKFANITNGYFLISKHIDDSYSINFACKDEYGDSIIGRYIGNLIYIDSSN